MLYVNLESQICLAHHPYLNEEFPDLSEKESNDILVYWMETFTKRKSKE
jgi:hypothetical protein